MSDGAHQEYDGDMIALLEAVWGEGFMSPGGTGEVDLFLQAVDLKGATVLDIGCGLGLLGFYLVERGLDLPIIGVDYKLYSV